MYSVPVSYGPAAPLEMKIGLRTNCGQAPGSIKKWPALKITSQTKPRHKNKESGNVVRRRPAKKMKLQPGPSCTHYIQLASAENNSLNAGLAFKKWAAANLVRRRPGKNENLAAAGAENICADINVAPQARNF